MLRNVIVEGSDGSTMKSQIKTYDENENLFHHKVKLRSCPVTREAVVGTGKCRNITYLKITAKAEVSRLRMTFNRGERKTDVEAKDDL